MRGKKPYYPPLGWIGIGLNVIDKYEDNIWIGMDNSEGEWCVAYHGVGKYKESNEVKNGHSHENCDDIFHPGKKVGNGVYCTPKIEFSEENASICEINGKKYKFIFMTRVKPDAIRQCRCRDDYWVVDFTSDVIRPYRILYKNVDS